MKAPVFENIFRSNEVRLKDGIAVCPYCNGTGLNAEFYLFNKINEELPLSIKACCLKCYGKGSTDWVEEANDLLDERMETLFRDNRQFPAAYLSFFFSYVYDGNTVTKNHTNLVRYNEDTDRWEDADNINWPGHLKSKEKVSFWIDKLNEHMYIEDPESIAYELREIYRNGPYYVDAERIKYQLLYESELKLETLIDFKNKLKKIGYVIEDLNDIDITGEFGEIIDIDFDFTWENLLDKFNLLNPA